LPPQLSVALQQVAAGMVFDKYFVETARVLRLKSFSRPWFPSILSAKVDGGYSQILGVIALLSVVPVAIHCLPQEYSRSQLLFLADEDTVV
jgi:hypothetical protein